jgi:hypothetical protein
VNLRLRHPVRYTRQLRRFIAKLKCPATEDLLRDFHGGLPLPEGPETEIHSLTSPLEKGAKCAQIAKEWLDKGLAKCHEIAVLYPSSRNPPAWLGKIHGITFFTPTGTPPSLRSVGSTSRRHSSASKTENSSFIVPTSSFPPVPIGTQYSKSNIQNSSSGDSSPAVACFSINRAKGLERRAIILTGLPAWEECAKNDYQSRTFVLGATRAQQLLAVLQ